MGKKKGLTAEQKKQLLEEFKKMDMKKEVTIRKGVKQSARQFKQAIQEFDPTFEQKVLMEVFGHGQKIWGQNQNPVNINHDLQPRMRDPNINGTASMFGFGNTQENYRGSTRRLFF